jgi:HEAT repeat protein
MVERDQKQKKEIKKKTRLLAIFATSFLGASVFAILSGFLLSHKAAQLVREEQLSQLPKILLGDSSLPQDSGSLAIRYRAAAILQAREAIPKLILLLQDPSVYVRHNAVNSLRELEAKEAIPKLISLLQDPSELVRSRAAYALGELKATEAIPKLILLLQEPYANVRSSTADSLRELNAKEEDPELLLLLSDSEYTEEIRLATIMSLSKLNAEEAIPELISLLQDPNENIRSSAANSLGELNAEEAIPELISLLQDPCEDVRASAADSLDKLNAKEAISKLILFLQYLGKHIRSIAAISFELKAKELIPELNLLLQDPPVALRSSTANSLGELNRKEVIPILIPLLQDPSGNVRFNASQVLGTLKAKEAVPELILLLQDPSVIVQFSAVQSLTKIYLATNQNNSAEITHTNQARSAFNLQLAFTVIADILAISLLLLIMLRQIRYLRGITWYGYWICYFPEEVIQDLADLSDRLAQEGKTTRQIRTRIYAEILTLIWVFYIQVNIENLWLPKGDRRIDD